MILKNSGLLELRFAQVLIDDLILLAGTLDSTSDSFLSVL